MEARAMPLTRALLLALVLTPLSGCLSITAVDSPTLRGLRDGDEAAASWRLGARETLDVWSQSEPRPSAELRLTLEGAGGVTDSVTLGRTTRLDDEDPRRARLVASAPLSPSDRVLAAFVVAPPLPRS